MQTLSSCKPMCARPVVASRVALRAAPVLPPRALFNKAPKAGRSGLVCRADAKTTDQRFYDIGNKISTEEGPGDFTLDEAKEKYLEFARSVPPTWTALAIPTIALSLLCKAITGSGLPGPLGLPEGLAFLILPIGITSFVPRVTEFLGKGEATNTELLWEILSREPEPTLRGSATVRINKLRSTPDSALGMQLKDLRARRREKESESKEETAARDAMNLKCAEAALNVGKSVAKEDREASQGVDLTKQKVTETIKQSITAENYDQDIAKFDEKDLGTKLDLSDSNVSSGTPTATGKVTTEA